MKRLSTRCMNEFENRTNRNRNEKKKSMPRRQTLDFLTQFARVYHSEPVLHPELCGVVMN
ncbi:hypothetical protein [Parabacteroides sp. AM08-6]|uniref:hypothetical protein n=1 Tax=Parabacteroides sp. AM08-6 TaxID=2292053 RepID=UPI000EFEC09A|nr:hypothetical protein [Parabacteroides sp. AM08-6]RHJ84397.1 hypothetical protein DW103_06075 [Parabacteroides sp. AM08-6]